MAIDGKQKGKNLRVHFLHAFKQKTGKKLFKKVFVQILPISEKHRIQFSILEKLANLKILKRSKYWVRGY